MPCAAAAATHLSSSLLLLWCAPMDWARSFESIGAGLAQPSTGADPAAVPVATLFGLPTSLAEGWCQDAMPSAAPSPAPAAAPAAPSLRSGAKQRLYTEQQLRDAAHALPRPRSPAERQTSANADHHFRSCRTRARQLRG